VKSTTLWEGVVTVGIANFPSVKGWGADRFPTLVGVPWPVKIAFIIARKEIM